MGKYAEGNLRRDEKIVQECKPNGLSLVLTWIGGILFFWLLFIPLIKAIIKTIKLKKQELVLTNKRLIMRVGFGNTASMDVPLDKIQNINVTQPFWGKLFNYSTIEISNAAGKAVFYCMKSSDAFKNAVLAQQEQYDQDKMEEQAQKMAAAMASAINK